MKYILTLSLTLSSLVFSELRTWTSQTGSTLEAKLVDVNGSKLTLEKDNGQKLQLPTSALSTEDQAKLPKLIRDMYGYEIEGINAKPGEISPVITCLKSKWTYHVYLPKKFHLGRKWPVWFITSPSGGQKSSTLKRYIPGAELTQSILVLSVESKNHFGQSQEAGEAMIKDVYKRFPVEKNFAFTSGMSGGGRMAFLLAEGNRDIVGIINCGANHGVYPDNADWRYANIRSGVYVYSLMGTTCFNRTGAYATHKGLPKDYRLRYFKGRHVWADANLLKDAMVKVMGEAIASKSILSAYKEKYIEALSAHVDYLKSGHPYEAFYLAEFAKNDLKVSTSSALYATYSELKDSPAIVTAQAAEKDILKFADKFYLKYDYHNGDTEEKADRSKAANRLAEEYQGTPYEETFTLLGQKSPAPKSK